MSRSSATDDLDPETKKRKLRELANSDRPTAPIYAAKFRRDYGEEP